MCNLGMEKEVMTSIRGLRAQKGMRRIMHIVADAITNGKTTLKEVAGSSGERLPSYR